MLPYVVDDTFFATRAAEAAPGREALRQSLGIEPGRPLLLFCGKLLADKGLIPLVRAMGEVARRWDKGRGAAPLLLVAGEGELRGDLESLVAEICPGAVRLLGFRNQTELPALYDLCDLFVLPSLFEPWGLVVNEAMAAGRTVIVSDRVGCRVDLVQEGVNGSVARAGDPSALATAILQWLEKPQALAAAGSASRSILARWRARFEAAPLGELLAVAMQKT
jgi:glycosyltransferase involved in cell wall biosynthesis